MLDLNRIYIVFRNFYFSNEVTHHPRLHFIFTIHFKQRPSHYSISPSYLLMSIRLIFHTKQSVDPDIRLIFNNSVTNEVTCVKFLEILIDSC